MAEERWGALACPLRGTLPSRQVKASRGRRAGDPLIPAHDGYLRVLLSQLLVLPLQLCGGHGLPRPVQARLPRPSATPPAPNPRHARVRLCQRLSASPPPPRLLLHFRVRPGAGRLPGAGRRLTSPPHPPAPEHVPRAVSLARLGSASGTGGAILTHGPRWRLRTGESREGKRMMRVHRMGGGPKRVAVVAKSGGPEEETF